MAATRILNAPRELVWKVLTEAGTHQKLVGAERIFANNAQTRNANRRPMELHHART